MKFFLVPVALIFVAVCAFFLGPRAEFDLVESPKVDTWSISLDSLDRYVKLKDQDLPHLKPDNESRIYWVGDSIHKTSYSVVYLHGFSASPMESNPVHIEFARRMGYNLYIPLLYGHGQDDPESFLALQPNDLVRSAKEAVAIGQLLGEDVILMSCSTGGTLSIYLAGANPKLIDMLIMYSPNVAIYDKKSRLITGPWGEQVVKSVLGDYHFPDSTDSKEIQNYWTTQYRNEGVIALQSLIDQTMKPEIFHEIKQPYFLGYYYKNPEEQDMVVSVEAMLSFNQKTSTPEHQKKLIAYPNAGAHVMTNPLKSDSWEAVLDSTIVFAQAILNAK